MPTPKGVNVTVRVKKWLADYLICALAGLILAIGLVSSILRSPTLRQHQGHTNTLIHQRYR